MNFRVEKIRNSFGKESVILVDKDYKIVEEVALFLDYIETKGLAQNTVDSYCRCLKEYYNWLESLELRFYEVKTKDLIHFIKYLNTNTAKKKSARTINKYLATVTSFYNYFEAIDGYIEVNPLNKLEKQVHTFNVSEFMKPTDKKFLRQKTTSKTNNKRLFPKQIELIYKGIECIYTDPDIIKRDKLIFRLLYETGMRVSECIGLRISDYSEMNGNEEVGIIYLRKHENIYHVDHSFKTNERNIPVSMDLIEELDEYVSYYRPYIENIDTIFVSHRGKNKGSYLTRQSMVKFFSRISEYSGIHCTAHLLRHTHGTELAESGYEQIYIKDRLGHSSLSSTNKYMHISLEAQTKAYEEFVNLRERAFK